MPTFNRPTHEHSDGRIITYRSGWEGNYSLYLDWLKGQGEIKEWEYEPERYKFVKKEGSYKVEFGNGYLPDFRITNNDGRQYLVEIKGRMQGKRKLQRMKKYYPHIKIELIQAKEYNELKKKIGRMLNWT